MSKYEKPSRALDEKLKKDGYSPAYGQANLYSHEKDGRVVWVNGNYYREANSWEWKNSK